MATFKNFEEINAWQEARRLTREIYDVSNRATFAKDFGLRDQIRKASVSIMSNIAEGCERGGPAEFTRFLSIAKGSSGEVRAQLYICVDQGYLSAEVFLELSARAARISRMLSGLITYLRSAAVREGTHKSRVSKKDT